MTVVLIPHRSKWYAAVRFSGGPLDGLTLRVARLGLDASGRLRRIAWLSTVSMDDRAGRREAGAPAPGAALREAIALAWRQQQQQSNGDLDGASTGRGEDHDHHAHRR